MIRRGETFVTEVVCDMCTMSKLVARGLSRNEVETA